MFGVALDYSYSVLCRVIMFNLVVTVAGMMSLQSGADSTAIS